MNSLYTKFVRFCKLNLYLWLDMLMVVILVNR